ncbi:RtcB-like protein [Tubulinosema ratisbonensis]|uniref:3'-phosphate/5'-hydroxy nucleic acid ligase n=1 Tax=Tubulinosema ratisbonensis TaxID=291195 RepID=A0A437AHG5_9MICR|nr:RtcB-like protein [Tubulinosema ratisbonensis]
MHLFLLVHTSKKKLIFLSKNDLITNKSKNNLFKNISVGSEKEISLRKKYVESKKTFFGENKFIKTYRTNEKTKAEEITLKDLNGILDSGLRYLKENGIIQEDLQKIENFGSLEGNSRLISQKAKGKGLKQIATLGSGNHYIEVQVIEEVFDNELAHKMGLKKDQIVYSIHTGSRGLGHQVKTEFDEILSYKSKEGEKYFLSMQSAANFAFANRALICKKVKKVFYELFKNNCELIYDVSHNIITKEKIDNKEYLFHRKGASRSFGKEICEHPIPVGGSMGTSSYLLLGTQESQLISLGGCCHGSGRIFSRKECLDNFTLEDLQNQMEGIHVRFGNERGLLEEIPSAYKNIEEVVLTCERNNIAKRIIKVKPLLVIKG